MAKAYGDKERATTPPAAVSGCASRMRYPERERLVGRHHSVDLLSGTVDVKGHIRRGRKPYSFNHRMATVGEGTSAPQVQETSDEKGPTQSLAVDPHLPCLDASMGSRLRLVPPVKPATILDLVLLALLCALLLWRGLPP